MADAFLPYFIREPDALRRRWFDVTPEFDVGEGEADGHGGARPAHAAARVLP
jgi:hypothetical protein